MRLIVLLLVFVLPGWCLASNSLRLPVYVSGFVDRQSIGIEGQKVRPAVVSASVGLWVVEGIAAELEFGAGVRDDSVNRLQFVTRSQVGINLRLESAAINSVAAYALFGYSRSDFETDFTDSSDPADSRSFGGFRAAFGLTFPVSQRWTLDASFSHHEFEDDFGFNAFRVGARYAINDVKPARRTGWLR